MNHGENLGVARTNGAAHRVNVHRPPPRGIHPSEPPPDAVNDVRHTGSEHAVDTDDDLVAGLYQVDETGLHAGAAGAGNRDGQCVFSLEEKPQQLLRLVHHGYEAGIEMADAGGGKGPQHTGRDVAGPRSHQRSRGRIDVGELSGINRHLQSPQRVWVRSVDTKALQ